MMRIDVRARARPLSLLGAILGCVLLISVLSQDPRRKEAPLATHSGSRLSSETYSTALRVLHAEAEKIRLFLEDARSAGKLRSASLYFERLDSALWFGISEEAPFVPGSLFKLPILLAYLKAAQDRPALLRKTRPISLADYPSAYDEQVYSPERRLVDGQSYTIWELLSQLIVYSDNLADLALVEEDEVPDLAAAFHDLGLADEDGAVLPLVSARGYAEIFKRLYQGGYLNAGMKEKALDLLSQTAFKDGLRAGVPSEVRVAHKFGEKGWATLSEKQLHDCGIVYARNPYVLCVMTAGNDFRAQAGIIAEVSRRVFGLQL